MTRHTSTGGVLEAMIAGMTMCLLPAALAAQSGSTAQAQTDAQALQRMVSTERAFAAATAEVGVRDGFLAFLADDGVQIQRGATVTLVPAREQLAARPLSPLPLSNRLIWEPFTGHVSSDGLLGWLTGGYVLMSPDSRTVISQGAYFSVWKRQPDGTWRVWLDEGISLPAIWEKAAPFRVAPDPDAGTSGEPGEAIEAAESSVAAGGDAWRSRLAADARLHIDGLMPIAGSRAIASSPRGSAAVTYRLVRAEVAGSGDLAIAIGSFDDQNAPGTSNGSWVRVWKRDVPGRWRIVFQTETATPPRQ
jgi:ketosteroid isomerase-like protein